MKASLENIRSVVDAWQGFLGLKDWSINVQVFNEPRPLADDGAPKRLETQAEIEIHAGYFRADMRVYTPEIEESELEQVIVHELCHVVLHDLEKMAHIGMGEKFNKLVSDALEQTTERVSKSLVTLAKARRDVKRKVKKTKKGAKK